MLFNSTHGKRILQKFRVDNGRIVTNEPFWQPKHMDASIQKQKSSTLTVQSLFLTRNCQYIPGLTADDDHKIVHFFSSGLLQTLRQCTEVNYKRCEGILRNRSKFTCVGLLATPCLRSLTLMTSPKNFSNVGRMIRKAPKVSIKQLHSLLHPRVAIRMYCHHHTFKKRCRADNLSLEPNLFSVIVQPHTVIPVIWVCNDWIRLKVPVRNLILIMLSPILIEDFGLRWYVHLGHGTNESIRLRPIRQITHPILKMGCIDRNSLSGPISCTSLYRSNRCSKLIYLSVLNVLNVLRTVKETLYNPGARLYPSLMST